MSSNIFHNSNKENAVRSKALARSKQEGLANRNTINARMPENANKARNSKDRLEKSSSGIQRVPLGGKDQNQLVPSLSRSKSSLNTLSDNKQRKKILLPVKPSLSKSKSSLGFIHNDVISHRSSDAQKDAVNTVARKPQAFEARDDLSPIKAARGIDVMDNFTDALEKPLSSQIQHGSGQRGSISLAETLSPKTEQLHVSNIEDNSINDHNVDPIKQSPKRPHTGVQSFESNKSLKSRPHMQPLHIPKELIEDPDSIEYVPHKETPTPYVPVDIVPFTDEDLEFFSGDRKHSHNKTDITETAFIDEGISSDNFDIDLEFTKDSINEGAWILEENESKEANHQGLTIDELNDLIDF